MPEGREWRLLVAGLAIADLAAYEASLILVARQLPQPGLGPQISSQYWLLMLLAVPVLVAIFVSQGLYDPHNLLGGTREYAAVLRSCTYGLVGLVLLSFAVRIHASREWSVLSWLLAAALVGASRFAIRRLAYRLRLRGLFVSRALLVGADSQAVSAARQMTQRSAGIRLVGVLDDYLPVGSVIAGRLRVLGPSAALAEVAAMTGAQEVVVVPQALPWESLQSLLAVTAAASEGPRVHLLAGFYDLLAAGVRLSQRSGVPLLTVRRVALTTAEAVVKRSLDWAVAVVLLAGLAPVLTVEMIGLRLRGRPAIRRRRALDRKGRAFDLLSLPPGLITNSALIGHLPTLVNVLRGEMSVVGPSPIFAGGARPAPAAYPTVALRPGLTGLWRTAGDEREQALLDLYYVRGYSIWLDLQILFDRLKTRLGLPPRRIPSLEGDAVRVA